MALWLEGLSPGPQHESRTLRSLSQLKHGGRVRSSLPCLGAVPLLRGPRGAAGGEQARGCQPAEGLSAGGTGRQRLWGRVTPRKSMVILKVSSARGRGHEAGTQGSQATRGKPGSPRKAQVCWAW